MKTKYVRSCMRILFIVLSIISTLSGCNFSEMPFNGDITFHNISMTVDQRFIRDSTQSTEDLWIFEHGNYSEYIILSRKDVDGNITDSLNGYIEYLTEQGANAELVTFLERDAVFSSYMKEDQYCQELLFAHEGSFYAIALRGGTEEGFGELIDTVQLPEEMTS